MKLALEVDGDRFSPGRWIIGRVRVLAGGSTRSLDVTLRFVEKSPQFKCTAWSVGTGSLHSGELVAGQVLDFSLALPPDALPSASSAHAELYWELDARSDEPGLDTHAHRRIEVTVEPRRAA